MADDICANTTCPFNGICKPSGDRKRVECNCNIICAEIYRPVCGTDGETHSNECKMKAHACEKQKEIKKDYDGECSGKSYKRPGVSFSDSWVWRHLQSFLEKALSVKLKISQRASSHNKRIHTTRSFLILQQHKKDWVQYRSSENPFYTSSRICCQSQMDNAQIATVIKTILKLIFSSVSSIRQGEFAIMEDNARNVTFLRWQFDPCRLACCQIFVLLFTTGTAPWFL